MDVLWSAHELLANPSPSPQSVTRSESVHTSSAAAQPQLQP